VKVYKDHNYALGILDLSINSSNLHDFSPQVEALFSDLAEVCNGTVTLYNATLEVIRETSSLGVVSRAEANDLLTRARQQAMQARRYRDVSTALMGSTHGPVVGAPQQ
jgi:hypothetical protein